MKQYFLFMVGVFCIAAPNSFAQMSVALSPTEVFLTGEPGSAVTHEFLVTNEGSTAYELGCLFHDLWFEDEETVSGELGTYKEGQAGYLVQCTPNRILVPARHVQKVKITAAIPKDQEGETFTRFYAQMLPPRFGGATAMVGFSAKVGATIGLTAKGTEKLQIELPKIQLETTQSFQKLHLVIHNQGNVHVSGEGHILIMDPKEVMQDKVQLRIPFLFPGQKKSVSVNLTKTLPKGTYQALMTFNTKHGPLVKEFNFTY